MKGEKIARKLAAKIRQYGQSLTALSRSTGAPCPCLDVATGFCDPMYHIDHPEAPQCNENGLVGQEDVEVEFKGLVLPIDERNEAQFTGMGVIQKDDLALYFEGASDLSTADYIVHKGNSYNFRNADEYLVGDVVVCRVGLLRVRIDANTV